MLATFRRRSEGVAPPLTRTHRHLLGGLQRPTGAKLHCEQKSTTLLVFSARSTTGPCKIRVVFSKKFRNTHQSKNSYQSQTYRDTPPLDLAKSEWRSGRSSTTLKQINTSPGRRPIGTLQGPNSTLANPAATTRVSEIVQSETPHKSSRKSPRNPE